MPFTTLMPSPRQRFYTNLGTPAAFHKLYTYSAGTVNPKACYQDAAGTVSHENPITLDAKGEALIYFAAGNYKIDLKDPLGIQVTGFPVDNFEARDPSVAASALRADLAAAGGSGLSGFTQAGTGTISRTVQGELRERVSVTQFGAVGDGVADDTAEIQAALDAMALRGGGTVFAPPGRYRLTGKITIPSFVLLKGMDWLPDPSNGAHAFQTTLLIDWGADSEQHAIEMSHSSGIDGFAFFYPGQVAKTASTPVAFGFSISTPTAVGVYDNIHVKNINLYNSYRGIRLNRAGRYRVENVQGNPLLMGFSSSDCYDACYISKVHFWNFYTQGAALETWMASNGTAFEFWRIDQLFGNDLFGWNYQTCFHCRDGAWLSLSNILCDKASFPFIVSASATINVTNFVLIAAANVLPGIWVKANAGTVRFSNGEITSTASVGVQVDDTTIVQIDNVNFNNQHAAVVSTSETSEIYVSNCRWKIPPIGSYNVRVNGERLPHRSTAVTLPAPTDAPTAIAGGYQFDLSTVGAKKLSYETTNISQRNSLYVLEFDMEQIGVGGTWYWQFLVQNDVGANTQVNLAPLYPLMLNGAVKKIRVPFFLNHGRFKQLMQLIMTPTVTMPGASVKITNIALYEQANKYTTDAQVSNMMRSGYNLDAFNMGQTLFSKGKNRIVITQSEAGIGRPTEVPTDGAWAQGDVVQVYNPVAGGPTEYVCVTAGTPGAWKAGPLLAA